MDDVSNMLRSELASIGVDLPDPFDEKDIERVLVPFLRGDKGREMGQKVFDAAVTALVAWKAKDGMTFRQAYRWVKKRLGKSK